MSTAALLLLYGYLMDIYTKVHIQKTLYSHITIYIYRSMVAFKSTLSTKFSLLHFVDSVVYTVIAIAIGLKHTQIIKYSIENSFYKYLNFN